MKLFTTISNLKQRQGAIVKSSIDQNLVTTIVSIIGYTYYTTRVVKPITP
jgi:hypothetical protein